MPTQDAMIGIFQDTGRGDDLVQLKNSGGSVILNIDKQGAINWRNNANTADIALSKDTSDNLTYNGNVIATASGSVGAMKPATSDAIQYVTTNGNDANDGLSWGTAKATIQAAVNALPTTPDGSTSGIVYVAPGIYTFSTGIVLPASHLHDSISIIGTPGYGTESPSESVQGGTVLNYTGSGAAISQVVASFANEADLAGSIRDIVINGANATGSAIGIRFGGMLNMDIRDVSIVNFSGTGQIGIQVDNISTGGAVFTERYHFANVSFENDNIGLQFKTESGGGASFAHSSGNIIYFDLYNGQTGISVVGGAVVNDGDWTFNGNFTGTSTFMSVDGTSAFKGVMNFLCEASPGSSVTRFSVASGGQVVVDGNFQPNGTFTDANSGTLLLIGDQNFFGIAAQRFTAIQHSNPATTGQINLTSGDTIAWRNNANTADVALGKNTSDALTYNGNVIATTSGPVSPPAFAVDLTAQAANFATQTFTTPSANGFYMLSSYLVITQAATTSSTTPTVNVNYTDADSGVAESIQVISSSSANTVGTVTGGLANVFYAKAGVAITLSSSGYASSGTTAMQYALHARLQGPF
jgi:hypothetical protein